jgi:hypothetical protein
VEIMSDEVEWPKSKGTDLVAPCLFRRTGKSEQRGVTVHATTHWTGTAEDTSSNIVKHVGSYSLTSNNDQRFA